MDDMTDGQAPAPEETLAPGAEEASAEVEQQTPEATAGDDGEETTAQPEGGKTSKGVQKRLDELTKRWHEERRDKERLLGLLERGGVPHQPQPQAPSPVAVDAEPTEDQFQDYDAYQRALTKWEVRQELKAEQVQTAAQSRREALFSTASAKYADFQDVISNPALPITPVMADVIYDSEHGADIAYHLGNNPDEAQRIASLPAHRQAIELGKLELRISAPPAPRTPPPAPPKTVEGIAAGHVKDPSKMSMAEYVEARKAGKI